MENDTQGLYHQQQLEQQEYQEWLDTMKKKLEPIEKLLKDEKNGK